VCYGVEGPGTYTSTKNTFEDGKVNSLDQSDTASLVTRSSEPTSNTLASSDPNEAPNASSAPEVEAKLQTDYDFHGFNKEGEDKDQDDYQDVDEDDELLYGDITGTNETMGGQVSTNHTTATNLNLVNGTKHVENSGHVEKTSSESESSGNSDTNPSNGQVTLNTPEESNSHSEVTSSEQNHGITSQGADKTLGNVNVDVSGNSATNVHGNFGETPGNEASTSAGISQNVEKNNQAAQENSGEQNTEPQSGQFSSQNSHPVNEDNGGNTEQATPTNQGTALNQQNTDQNTGIMSRNSEQSGSSQSVSEANGDNTKQATPTNQGTALNQQNTDQNTGTMFRNSEQSGSSQSVSEANGDNTNNQGQGNNLNEQGTDQLHPSPTVGNNGSSDANIQNSLENPHQGNDVTNIHGNADTTGNSNSENKQSQTEPLSKDGSSIIDTNNQNNQGRFATHDEKDWSLMSNKQSQTEPLSKDGSSNIDTNNQNIQGRFATQNEKDGSLMSGSQDTQTQNNVNLEHDNADNTHDNSGVNLNPDLNVNLNPGGSLKKSENQVLPEHTHALNEGTSQEQHDPTKSTVQTSSPNSNEPNNTQSPSNSLEASTDSGLEATGKPEYITAQQDEPQSEITHAWGGTGGIGGISQKDDEGKGSLRIQNKAFVFIIIFLAP
jgi:hypothetical protein